MISTIEEARARSCPIYELIFFIAIRAGFGNREVVRNCIANKCQFWEPVDVDTGDCGLKKGA